ncbi:DUF998 domain-containing protein [Kibdelosporangium aridum]|uniref:DUF998 domain-containing protein n=1 Tax=Kibdelosporangium aridum TaxID=2030 RepID=A0A428ZIN3_KIBAR|nr:DUF998 domain-containing protein [Kibdelosporangium aridum]RSM87942.1 DUF998 domain-containing protein [Kibdelosporangium aridum]
MLRRTKAATAGAVLLVAGPILYLIAEAAAALAWTAPSYDYFYHYVSDLGIAGPPSHVFGQDVYSPWAAVMNTGFIGYGVLFVVAAALVLRPSTGARPKLLLAISVIFGVGIAMVGLFQGSQASIDNGNILFHLIGAQATIVSGNLLSILAASLRGRFDMSPAVARSLLVLGVIGLIGFAAFMIDVRAGINVAIGLFERLAIYPIVVAHVLFGVSLLVSRARRTTVVHNQAVPAAV